MKLKVERRPNQQPTGIAQVRLLNDELNGYSIVMSVGNEFVIVKASDLLDLISEQSKPEADGVNE